MESSISDLLLNYSEDSFDTFAFDDTDDSFFVSTCDDKSLPPSFTSLFEDSEAEDTKQLFEDSEAEDTKQNLDDSTDDDDDEDEDEDVIDISFLASKEGDKIINGRDGAVESRLKSELKSVLTSKTNAVGRFLKSLEMSVPDLLKLCKQYPDLLTETTHKKREKYGHRRRLSANERRSLVKERNREHSHNLRVRRKLYDRIRRQIGVKLHAIL